MTQARPADQSSWFNSARVPSGPSSKLTLETDLGNPEDSDFARLWRAFMTARVMIALSLLSLYLFLYFASHTAPAWLLILSAAYLLLTFAVRLLAHPRRQGRHFDGQWLYTAGADLGFFGLLFLQQINSLNFSPLLALPVLMAAILGSRPLALGTAALATLLLLGFTIRSTSSPDWAGSAEWAQTALAGGGLLVLGWLISHLAGRLAREERTARRNRAEAREQSMVNNMVIETLSDGVLVVDAHCVVRAANPAARLMLNSDREVTPPIFNLDDNPAWSQLAEIAHMSFADRAVDSAQIVLRHADLQSSHLQVRTLLTPSLHDGRKGLCVMFLQDMREMEAQLRTEKLAAMGRMSAAVAHEIRNPLSAISQANALLEEELEKPEHRRLSEMVRQNAQRLGHIVDDVLAIARVQHQVDDGFDQVVELNSCTEVICQDWAQQNGAGAILDLKLNAPKVHIQFSREHLRRVLINLLDNALRYASRSPGAIEVKTHVVREGPVMLAVWSDGAAMEPTVRRHLFEPFFSSESRSTGLGLFICRELCERHASSISYERSPRERDNKPVDGNEFFLSLRRAPGSLTRPPLQDLP